MAKVTLKLLDLTRGNRLVRDFDDESSAIAFLVDRPKLLDVLGVVVQGVTPEQNARFKAAMRPLDAEERAAETKLAEAAAAAEAIVDAQRRAAAVAARAEAHARILADPGCAMEVSYRYDKGVMVAGDDPRELTDEARAAVEAWVEERNEWVRSRGQVVGEAKLTVWPAALPGPGVERVQTGTFVPVSAGDSTKN